MPERDAFFEVDDRLGDSGRVIGYSLKMPPNTHQLQPGVKLLRGHAAASLLSRDGTGGSLINRAIAADQHPRTRGISRRERFVAGPGLIEHVAPQRLQ